MHSNQSEDCLYGSDRTHTLRNFSWDVLYHLYLILTGERQFNGEVEIYDPQMTYSDTVIIISDRETTPFLMAQSKVSYSEQPI